MLFRSWLEECTEKQDDRAFSRSTELFTSWKTWCEAHNLKTGSQQAFSGVLADRGFVKGREGGTGKRGFHNLVVKIF